MTLVNKLLCVYSLLAIVSLFSLLRKQNQHILESEFCPNLNTPVKCIANIFSIVKNNAVITIHLAFQEGGGDRGGEGGVLVEEEACHK